VSDSNVILTNFTAGELSPRIYGRVDLAKYQNGARELRNVMSLPQGGARKRGGTLFIAPVHDDTARLVKFEYSTQQAYQLEFGENYIRFFKDRAVIADVQKTITNVDVTSFSQPMITANAHGFSNGDHVILTGIVGPVELNNREYEVINKTINTFRLKDVVAAGLPAYVSGGLASRIYEVATNYTAADVAALNFTQSADTLFIFSSRWPIAKLIRHSHASWTLETGNVEEGPFLDMNTDETNTVSIDVASGVGIMTFSQDTLEASHLGALFRVWEYANGSTFGYATWAPGASVTVADGSFWEYKGNVYYVVSGGGAAMSSTASYPTHTTGTATIYYGTGGQSAQMRYEHSGYAVVQITEVVDTKNAWVNVVKNRVPYTAYAARSSPQWQEGAWSDKRGYPACGTFHEQRLVAAGTEHQPSTYWGSVLNAYLKFKDSDKDDESYKYTISSDKVDAIKFMESTKRLNLFATGGEYIGQATSTNEALTPTNIKTSPETAFGTAEGVKPIRAGPAVLFAQRKGKNENAPRRVREFVYNFQTDQFTAPDLTILADHITKPGLVRGAYIASPDVMVWYCRADGNLCTLTYERDQQVVGWHAHFLGANDDGALVKDLSPLPGDTGDELWMIVERVINGETVRYIEVLTQGLEDDQTVEDAFFLDCGLTYEGAPADTISGLRHLEGDTVQALADGIPVRNLVVTDGSITLPFEASKVTIGYPYLSRIKTLRIEAGAKQGTAQGQIGRVNQIVARLQSSLGGRFGREGQATLDPIDYRNDGGAPITEALPLFSGDKNLDFDGDWDQDRYIVIEHDDPLPFTLTAIVIGQRISG
jgi:hypothetical protein